MKNKQKDAIPSNDELRKRIKDAKADAKDVKSSKDVQKFLKDNKHKIDDISKKLKGDAKKNFDAIVSKLEQYKDNKLNESDNSIKWMCGLVAIIMWMIGLGPAWIVGALSPVIGPILQNAVKKIVD